jgi:hypothetical protein
MKKIISFLVFAAVLSANTLFAQDESMKKWMEYMTPGDIHKMLAQHAGTWTAKTTFWMTPGADATVSEATAVGEMILGGRYLMSKFTGNMMGMPFEGMSLEGYDNGTKKFYSTWIDNMGTGIMYMTGEWDPAGKKIEYSGKTYDPMAGKMVDVRQIVKYNDDGTVNMEMFGPDNTGKEFKTMEIMMTKK